MKHLFLILFFFISYNLFCLCDYNKEPYVWPTKSSINCNPIFQIITKEIRIQTKDFVFPLSLFSKYPIYLISKTDTIKFEILYEFRVNNEYQLIVKAKTKLKSFTKYNLCVPYIHTSFYNPDNDVSYDSVAYKIKTYMTTNKIDNITPKWTRTPKFTGTDYIEYGCGSLKEAYFNYKVNDQSEYLIFSKIFNKKTLETKSVFIEEYNNEIAIGRTMCGGNFDFTDSVNYEIEFGIMDASGNINLEFGIPIKFKAIFESKEERYKKNLGRVTKSKVTLYLSLFLIGIIILVTAFIFKKNKNT